MNCTELFDNIIMSYVVSLLRHGGVPAGVTGLCSCVNQVTILEASERVGGRVHTYRDEKEGWYAELGAMRIPSFHR